MFWRWPQNSTTPSTSVPPPHLMWLPVLPVTISWGLIWLLCDAKKEKKSAIYYDPARLLDWTPEQWNRLKGFGVIRMTNLRGFSWNDNNTDCWSITVQTVRWPKEAPHVVCKDWMVKTLRTFTARSAARSQCAGLEPWNGKDFKLKKKRKGLDMSGATNITGEFTQAKTIEFN